MYIKPTAVIVLLFVLQPLILMGDELPRRTPNQSDPTVTIKTSTGEKSSMSTAKRPAFVAQSSYAPKNALLLHLRIFPERATSL
jgi:hypothetical protein